jgi:hypothetical protein
MPDRELPDDLKARLSAELIAATPLQAPLASQARYATAAAAGEREGFSTGHRWATAGVAALTLLLLTLVAVPPILNTVGNRGHNVVTPLTTPSASQQPAESPTPANASPSPEPSESPEPSDTPGSPESPEPGDSPQPVQSPQPHDSPEPSISPESGGGDNGGSSPSPSPSPANE